jgi:hypothetical protein
MMTSMMRGMLCNWNNEQFGLSVANVVDNLRTYVSTSSESRIQAKKKIKPLSTQHSAQMPSVERIRKQMQVLYVDDR